MSDARVSRADIASLASLSSHYTAVAAAAKAAHLGNNLFRIGTGQVVESNNVAVASLASLSSHYTAVAAAAKAAHLGNNLFRIGTGQLLKSNAATATSLAAVAETFAGVAAAAAATAEAVEAARAILDTSSPSTNTTGTSGSRVHPVAEEIWKALGRASSGATYGAIEPHWVTNFGLHLSSLSEKYVPDLSSREQWKSWLGELKDHVGDWGSSVRKFFDRETPRDIETELQENRYGSKYGPVLGMGDPNLYGGADIHINLNVGQKTIAETFVTREELAEAQAAGRAKVRLDGRR